MKTLPATVSAISLSLLLIAGCASTGGGSSSSSYPVTHKGAVHKVEDGTVVATRAVRIDGRATNMGRLVGAGIGTAVGSVAVPIETQTTQNTTIGATPDGNLGITQVSNTTSNVHENRAAMAVGGAVGMVVGQKVEKALTAKRAQELTVALDSGETVVIVQEYREPEFYDNERVKVYTTRNGESMVYHSGEDPTMDPDTNAYLVGETTDDLEFEEVVW